MNINKINSGNFSEKDIKKSERSKSAENSQVKPDSTQSQSAKTDQFSPSNIQLSGDFDLARNELNKLGTDSFSKLRKIKQKIDQGKYNSQEVHQKIGTLIEKDLGSLEQIISASSKSAEKSGTSTLSPEYKKYLIENPEVIQKVADGVAAELKKL